ncbi:MAG: hypothetical protein WCS47_05445 [Thermovirgaceae bacterium]|jgi:dolichol kinase|nr:hypothetical protein [Synergistales bacterium]MDI9393634.1 hypothetical protein [Synergistota bacterium]NLV64725.1 hypothetical protein [Synergistaceae bacterium]HRW87277.1 hypothetical protein [Thermovirgaceae bacterium]MDD3830636.1 hypothetical protein [Synergistales bacterium]
MSKEAYPLVLVIMASVAAVLLLVRGPGQIGRKMLRLMGLVFPLVVFPLWGIGVYRTCVILPAAVLALLEAARFSGRRDRSTLGRLLSPIAKEGEGRGFFGFSTYFWGSALASLAPGGTGPAVTAMATLCDPWASMAGTAWGGQGSSLGKTWVGSLTCLLVSSMTGLSFAVLFPRAGISLQQTLLASVAMTAAERYSPGEFDNLSIQVVGAAVVTLSSFGSL